MTAPTSLAQDAGVATLTLDVPHRANALSAGVVASLRRSLDAAVADGARALVLRAEGPVFCAGVDLSDAASVTDGVLAERFVAIEELLDALSAAPLLTIACVEGKAWGAGADLVAVCDYRIGTERAQFAFPGVRFGLLLGTHRLSRLVGGQAARDLLVEQRRAPATDAHRIGLLSHLVTADLMEQTVAGLVDGSRCLDLPTLRRILAITRGQLDESPMAVLRASVSVPGMADRLRGYLDEQRTARKESRQ